MAKKLEKLKKFETIFSQSDYFGNLKASIFSYVDHNSYVCLTAAHATHSTIHKSFKGSDLFTGGIVKYLGEENHISYIVRNKYFPKKATIDSFIVKNHLEQHYFLDIHAMRNQPFDLAVGIGYCSADNYQKELKMIQKLCKKYHLKYIINHPSYTGQPGLTGRLQRKLSQTNVLQLEWTRKFRDFTENPSEVLNITLPFIKELTIFLNSIHKEKLPHPITARYSLIQKIKNRINWFRQYFNKKF